MRIQQLRELLEYVAECHLDMAKLYHRLNEQADSSRTKLLLDYFEQHQKGVARHLEDYIDEAPKRILESWYKDFVFEDFSKRCENAMLPATMNDDDVLELHLELDNLLIGLLEKTANSSSAADVKSALEDLVRVQKIHQQRLVHSTMRMDDI
ncbi:hypothetical protein HR45_11035 [Shewanella mangrovi]|uniref:ATPase n=1 Tax=Shewanella mangrovi TaxID=1515746 RepID=A0A094JC98_9GAMM|nr:hypothetical protein [Shewanella mangrovi]KFZ37535.1 hypothetical protein HR45_11035 [Shewanella mangrovi]